MQGNGAGGSGTGEVAGLGSLPRPPKADGWPVLGQSLGFLLDTSALLTELYRKHGPAFRIRAGWNDFTVLAGREGRDFLLDGAERHLTREAFFRPVGEQLGRSDFVLGVSGARHDRLRRVLSIAYSRQIASPFVPELLAIVDRATRSWSNGAPVRVMPALHRIAYDLYTHLMMGEDLSAHYRDFTLLVGTNMAVGGRTMPSIAYRNPLYREARKRILAFMWEWVQRRRQTGIPADRPPTIIDTLLRVRDADGKALDDDEVVCYAMYGIAGSCSYMGRLIGFWLYELLRHPEILSQVRRDVDDGHARGIRSATDLRGMAMLHASWLESMRYHPVSQGLPFIAKEAFAFRGMRIEAGEQVVFSQIPMFQDAPPFRCPHLFDPQRCMAPRNEHKEGHFHPFGMGHRTCTAQGMVEVMSLVTMSQLVRRFELELSPKDYTLRMIAMPLPSPDPRFHVRVASLRDPAKSGTRVDEARLLASFPGADEPGVRDLLAAASRQTVAPGTVIVEQGEPSRRFYVVVEGEVAVTRKSSAGDIVPVATLRAGQYFGETGLLHNAPRSATVTAAGNGPTRLLVLIDEQFGALIRTGDLVGEEIASLVHRRHVEETLRAALPTTRIEDLQGVMPEFTLQTFPAGEVVLREGDPADRFFVIHRGTVEVTRAGSPIATLGEGDFFGETGLLLGQPRNATIAVAADAPLQVIVTDAEGFRRLIDASGVAHADLAVAMSRRLLALRERTDAGAKS